MKVLTIGIDLAKNSFSLHGIDLHDKVKIRKTVKRQKLLETIAQLPSSLIAMEACSGAHHWARVFQTLEQQHDIRIIAPKFVAPYRKGGKNDSNDAEAICEAASRPSMRFVPVKTVDQQAVLCVHRIRQELVQTRTAFINQIRGLLTEFGIVMAQGRYPAQKELHAVLEDAENGLPWTVRQSCWFWPPLTDIGHRVASPLWPRLSAINACNPRNQASFTHQSLNSLTAYFYALFTKSHKHFRAAISALTLFKNGRNSFE